jgi:hypothetical protein
VGFPINRMGTKEVFKLMSNVITFCNYHRRKCMHSLRLNKIPTIMLASGWEGDLNDHELTQMGERVKFIT